MSWEQPRPSAQWDCGRVRGRSTHPVGLTPELQGRVTESSEAWWGPRLLPSLGSWTHMVQLQGQTHHILEWSPPLPPPPGPGHGTTGELVLELACSGPFTMEPSACPALQRSEPLDWSLQSLRCPQGLFVIQLVTHSLLCSSKVSLFSNAPHPHRVLCTNPHPRCLIPHSVYSERWQMKALPRSPLTRPAGWRCAPPEPRAVSAWSWHHQSELSSTRAAGGGKGPSSV